MTYTALDKTIDIMLFNINLQKENVKKNVDLG